MDEAVLVSTKDQNACFTWNTVGRKHRSCGLCDSDVPIVRSFGEMTSDQDTLADGGQEVHSLLAR